MPKGSSAINIPCSGMLDFYKKYLLFIRPLKPISMLGNKQLEVLTAFLVKRHEIAESVKDEAIIPKLLFSNDVRKAIMESCNISSPSYYNIVAMFKREGIIEDNDFNKRVLPDLLNNKFLFKFGFTINEESNEEQVIE